MVSRVFHLPFANGISAVPALIPWTAAITEARAFTIRNRTRSRSEALCACGNAGGGAGRRARRRGAGRFGARPVLRLRAGVRAGLRADERFAFGLVARRAATFFFATRRRGVVRRRDLGRVELMTMPGSRRRRDHSSGPGGRPRRTAR